MRKTSLWQNFVRQLSDLSPQTIYPGAGPQISYPFTAEAGRGQAREENAEKPKMQQEQQERRSISTLFSGLGNSHFC
jgi:hypothetical protein